ncbi:MAG: hypothetical protein ABIE94_06405 [archaeon]
MEKKMSSLWDKIGFTPDYGTVLERSPFDSATLTFVLHDGNEELPKIIFNLLKPGAYFTVMDYRMQGMNLDEFAQTFISDAERDEIALLGLKEAHRLHTMWGLFDGKSLCEEAGFETVECGPLNSRHYYWVGQKPLDAKVLDD